MVTVRRVDFENVFSAILDLIFRGSGFGDPWHMPVTKPKSCLCRVLEPRGYMHMFTTKHLFEPFSRFTKKMKKFPESFNENDLKKKSPN